MDSQTSRVVLGCGEETQLVLRKAGVFVRVIRPLQPAGADVTLEVTAWSEEENWTADREAIARLANEALAALGGAGRLPALEAVQRLHALTLADHLRDARLERLEALLALADDPPADLVAAMQGSPVLAVNALWWLRLRLVDHSPDEPELYEKETQGLRERQARERARQADAAAKQRAAMDVLHADAALGRQLVTILSDHCGERGDSEGAVDTLLRIIGERESLRRAYGELVDIDLRHTTHQAILKTQNATLVAENQHLLGNLKELESASVRASRLASRNAALEAENKRLAQRLAERERPLTVPWFKGLSMEEINTQILIGKAPGSNVAGGVIPVPGGYLNWLGSGGAAKDRPENSALRERLAALEKLADGVKEDLDQKYPLGSEPSEQPQGE